MSETQKQGKVQVTVAEAQLISKGVTLFDRLEGRALELEKIVEDMQEGVFRTGEWSGHAQKLSTATAAYERAESECVGFMQAVEFAAPNWVRADLLKDCIRAKVPYELVKD